MGARRSQYIPQNWRYVKLLSCHGVLHGEEPGLLQQQKILLTAEPSIQLQRMIFKINDAFQFDIHVGKCLTSILDEDQF